MARIPVHCCCKPGQRIGWLNHPRLNRPGDRVRVFVPRERPCRIGFPDVRVQPPRFDVDVVEVVVEPLLYGNGDVIAAVNSHERPIELWRKLPGFEPELAKGEGHG